MDFQSECDQKRTTAKHDPGWNDPPTFSYNTQSAPGVKPRLALNKRVAFPLQSSNIVNPSNSFNSQVPPLVPSMPVDSFNLIPTKPSISLANCGAANPSIASGATNYAAIDNPTCEGGGCDVEEVVAILHSILEENTELGSKIEDIKRRINVMKTMWIDGKLTNGIQTSMLDLSKALRNRDTKTADEIHKCLMVDHIGSVSSWMVAIKQLILHCTAKNELLSIDDD